jgi:cytochrome c oxidase subunit 2
MIARGLALGLVLGLCSSCAWAQPPSDPVARGKAVFTAQGCYGCHTVRRAGTPIASDLSRIGARYSRTELTRWLRDPASQRPTAHMPRITLADDEVEALAAYLASLR